MIFSLPGGGHGEVFQAVYENHGLACASMGGAFDGIRLSPHLYNTMEEVGLAVAAIAQEA